MSLLSGLQSGLRSGVRSGINPSYGSAPAATTDATSGKFTPVSAAEFTALSITAPQALWLPNITTTGDLIDQVGSLNLVAANSPTYQQTVAGWSTKAVSGTPGTTNARFSAAGTDVSTTDVCILWYVSIVAGTTANIQIFEDGDVRVQQVAADVTLRARNTTNLANTLGNHVGVHPVMLMHDATNVRTRLFTDVEKLTVTFAASLGTNEQITPVTASEPVGVIKFLWGCKWTGAAARVSDAQAKARLVALNWSIPWS